MYDPVVKRLEARHGSPVDVIPIPPGGQPPRGGWLQVQEGALFVRVHGNGGVLATLANIDLDLPTGPQRFVGMLEPVDAQTWRILGLRPVNHRRDMRVSVVLSALLGPIGGPLDQSVVVHNLSATGVAFQGQAHLEIHQRCALCFEGALGERFGTIEGILVRRALTAGGYRYGMRLLTGVAVQAKIYEYLFERNAMGGPQT